MSPEFNGLTEPERARQVLVALPVGDVSRIHGFLGLTLKYGTVASEMERTHLIVLQDLAESIELSLPADNITDEVVLRGSEEDRAEFRELPATLLVSHNDLEALAEWSIKLRNAYSFETIKAGYLAAGGNASEELEDISSRVSEADIPFPFEKLKEIAEKVKLREAMVDLKHFVSEIQALDMKNRIDSKKEDSGQ